MAVFLWIWQYIGPVALILGGHYFFEEPGGGLYLLENPSPLTLGLGGAAAVIGLIIGIVGWADTVPPRWFWIKSTSDLAGSRIMTAIGYAVQFFFLPSAILGLMALLG